MNLKDQNFIITESKELIIHFDLADNKHEIPVDQSIITEQSIKSIAEELNKIIFKNQFSIEVVVYADDDWWLIKKFWIRVIVWASFIAWAMFPDTANWVIKWLTWKDWSDHVENRTVIVKEMVQWFIEKKNSDLVNHNIWYEEFYSVYDAKNKFYECSLTNPDVQWIWFDCSHNFPIHRDSFWYRIVELEEKLSDLEPIDKFHHLTIVSQINTKDEKNLAWRVKDIKNYDRFYAYMKDKWFSKYILENHIYLESIKVKMRYHLKRDDNGKIKIDKKEITKVYEYNWKVKYPLPMNIEIDVAPWEVNDISSNDIVNVKKISLEKRWWTQKWLF